MKQIIGLSVLFDMSIASLSKIISQLNQAGLADSDKCRAVKKSIEGVERSIEKLQNLKTKVKTQLSTFSYFSKMSPKVYNN